MFKKGFDYEKYIYAQKAEVFKRLNLFDRLYLEFGGKLYYDGHASRVLPGYKKNTKIKLLKELGDFDLIYCVNSKELAYKRVSNDFNLTYFKQTIKDIKEIEKAGFKVSYVIITRYEGEQEARDLKRKLEKKGRRVLFHFEIKDYPSDLEKVLKGYSEQPFVHLKHKLVIVTGAAGGSGKMAVCLSQIYNESRSGMKTGFAKFETFPIWNLPLSHPINIAYEAATADLGDKNMFDPYHLKAYKKKVVNYNRDIENFAILQKIAQKITDKKYPFGYKSPTDMGINMASTGIINDEICRKAAIKEIHKRYKTYLKEYAKGREKIETIERMKKILKKIS